MLKPSYSELMEVLNTNDHEVEGQKKVNSRYSVVIAAAKRARQLIDGDDAMVKEINGKPVSTAVEELRNGKIKIVDEGLGTVVTVKKTKKTMEEYKKEHDDKEGKLDFSTDEESDNEFIGDELEEANDFDDYIDMEDEAEDAYEDEFEDDFEDMPLDPIGFETDDLISEDDFESYDEILEKEIRDNNFDDEY